MAMNITARKSGGDVVALMEINDHQFNGIFSKSSTGFTLDEDKSDPEFLEAFNSSGFGVSLEDHQDLIDRLQAINSSIDMSLDDSDHIKKGMGELFFTIMHLNQGLSK